MGHFHSFILELIQTDLSVDTCTQFIFIYNMRVLLVALLAAISYAQTAEELVDNNDCLEVFCADPWVPVADENGCNTDCECQMVCMFCPDGYVTNGWIEGTCCDKCEQSPTCSSEITNDEQCRSWCDSDCQACNAHYEPRYDPDAQSCSCWEHLVLESNALSRLLAQCRIPQRASLEWCDSSIIDQESCTSSCKQSAGCTSQEQCAWIVGNFDSSGYPTICECAQSQGEEAEEILLSSCSIDLAIEIEVVCESIFCASLDGRICNVVGQDENGCGGTCECNEDIPEVTHCSGELGDHSCICESGMKYSLPGLEEIVVDEILPVEIATAEPLMPAEEEILVYGRRKMAVYGQETYCGREDSCIFHEEVNSYIVGPVDTFYECLDMNTWETYEVSTYFPLEGQEMREGSSLAYCSDFRFFCNSLVVIDDDIIVEECPTLSCLEQPGMDCQMIGQDENGCGGTCECNEIIDECATLACGDLCNRPCRPFEACTAEMWKCQSDGTCGNNMTPECVDVDLTYCSGVQGDHSCVCDTGVKVSALVETVTIGDEILLPDEEYVVYGRRKMAIYGEEMYCGRENSCMYNQELDEIIMGPLRFFHDCLDMETWESYEISTYFPLDGEEMSEESSLSYCSDFTFHCLDFIEVPHCPICDACPPGMTEANEVDRFNCPTCGCTDLPARELGESCEYVFGIGDVGECAEGLVCMCVGPCADPMIADYPSTCIEERPNVVEEVYCSGIQGDHSCGCESGMKISMPVIVTEEPFVVYGRRNMAIYGQEMYCERENSCIYYEEVNEYMTGPLSFFHDCLDMSTWESYEISTYFPLDGQEMREGSSLAYCSDFTFHCLENEDVTGNFEDEDCSDYGDDIMEYVECLQNKIRDLEMRLDDVGNEAVSTCESIEQNLMSALEGCNCT